MYVLKQGYRNSVENYARVLYENYRARIYRATNTLLPKWEEASPFIRKEFRQEAKQALA